MGPAEVGLLIILGAIVLPICVAICCATFLDYQQMKDREAAKKASR